MLKLVNVYRVSRYIQSLIKNLKSFKVEGETLSSKTTFHIPLFSQRPFHFDCSFGALLLYSDKHNKKVKICPFKERLEYKWLAWTLD